MTKCRNLFLGTLASFELGDKVNELRWEACKQLDARAGETLPSLGMTISEIVTNGSGSEHSFSDYVSKVAMGEAGGVLEIEILAVHFGLSVSIYTKADNYYQRMSTLGKPEPENGQETETTTIAKEIFLLLQPGEYYDVILIH